MKKIFLITMFCIFAIYVYADDDSWQDESSATVVMDNQVLINTHDVSNDPDVKLKVNGMIETHSGIKHNHYVNDTDYTTAAMTSYGEMPIVLFTLDYESELKEDWLLGAYPVNDEYFGSLLFYNHANASGMGIKTDGTLISINNAALESFRKKVYNFPSSIEISYSGGFITNKGASDDIVFNLPSVQVGMNIGFAIVEPHLVTINPQDNDFIVCFTDNPGDELWCSTVGATIQLIGIDTHKWYVISVTAGIWHHNF